jgi:hypothetical protein
VILVIDSSALALLVNPAAIPPNDPATDRLLEYAKDRIEHLIAGFKPNDTIIIPTPVLAEALVRAKDGAPGVLEAINGLARVKVRAFDVRAAIETASMTREAMVAGDKKAGSQEAWQKVKVDRQIVAIARVEGANAIYADDKGLVSFARRLNIKVFSTWELPIPDNVNNLFTVAGLPPDGKDKA